MAPYWTQYTYDALGNRTAPTQHATDGTNGTVKTTYTYGTGGTSGGGPHQLLSTRTSVNGATAVAGASYTYDKAGNQTSRDLPDSESQFERQSLSWDAEGELTSISVPDDPDAEDQSALLDGEGRFTYDASGSRIVRTDAGGSTLYLPGGQEVHVSTDGEVSAVRYYSFGGQLVARRTGNGLGAVTSYVTDHHGTPLASIPNTTWTATSITKEYTDPFGKTRGNTDTDAGEEGSTGFDIGAGLLPGDRQFLGKTALLWQGRLRRWRPVPPDLPLRSGPAPGRTMRTRR